MDQTMHNPEVYDFRQYDRIWQRVAPNLEPYPSEPVQPMTRSEASAVPTSPAAPAASVPVQPTTSVQPAASVRPAASPVVPEAPAVPVPALTGLPGATQNPCCMGTAAADMLDVITGYIEASLSDRRYLLALVRQAPSWARQTLREQAADLQSHARQLMAAYYLITGQTYRPSINTERIYLGRWCPALRERYHAAACSGFNYARSAEDTTDPCLAKLFESLSEDAYRHAEELMGLLERQLGMRN